MFRKESGKGSMVEGIQLGLNSGCLMILAIWLLRVQRSLRVHPLEWRDIFPKEIAFQLHKFRNAGQ